jgi:hypothetical protein
VLILALERIAKMHAKIRGSRVLAVLRDRVRVEDRRGLGFYRFHSPNVALFGRETQRDPGLLVPPRT